MNVGSDKVAIEDGRLMIYASQPMDWPIREFSRVPIFFQGVKFYVRSKRDSAPPYRVIYELWPWPADLHQQSSESVAYDEAYVLERDSAAAMDRRGERFYLFLLPFYPFLGLFWSGFKIRVLGPMGFRSDSITRISIGLTFNLCILQAIFVGWLAGGFFTFAFGRSGFRLLDWALLILLGLDTVLRYAHSLAHHVDYHWGFCEWLWPRRRERG